MPAELDRCVAQVMARPDFEPREDTTAEESAFAICRSSLGLADDGSQDVKDLDLEDHDIRRKVEEEMMRSGFSTRPILRKKIPIASAIGKFVNGPMKGELILDVLKTLVENQSKHKRQIPIYLVTGKPNSDHPEDLDERLADGWVEGIEIQGRDLIADVKLHGDAAVAVTNDQVRGASIGTIAGADYKGNSIGYVLEHVILTNSPFIKGMNIAASDKKGGRKIAWYFTNFKKEAKMADKDEDRKKEPDLASLMERNTALDCLIQEKEKTIRELTESNENLTEELKVRQENQDLELSLKENRKLQRRVDALRIRELVALGIGRGQFRKDQVAGHEGGDARSDEVTLAWFKNSIFGGDLQKLDFALKTFPRLEMNRRYVSGAPGEQEHDGYSSEEQERIKKLGKDPLILSKTRGAKNFSDYKRLREEAKGA